MAKTLWIQSGVNKDGEPFIQLLLDEEPVSQLSPEEARDHAKNILEAAEASEQDAFMLDFFQTKVGLDLQRAFRVIVDFRQWREARGKKGPPSDPKEFMRTDKHEKQPCSHERLTEEGICRQCGEDCRGIGGGG